MKHAEIEVITEELGNGAKRHRVTHQPTGQYCFVEWCPYEPNGKVGATVLKKGTFKPARWKRFREMYYSSLD